MCILLTFFNPVCNLGYHTWLLPHVCMMLLLEYFFSSCMQQLCRDAYRTIYYSDKIRTCFKNVGCLKRRVCALEDSTP